MTHKIFPYSWHIDDQQQERTVIRIYGLNEKNQSICVTINDFTPYIYLELPENIEWNNIRANMLGKKIDDLCGKFRPLKKCLSFKKKLYYANVNGKDGSYVYKKFPFLMLSFSSPLDIKKVIYRLKRPIIVSGIGEVNVKVHEQDSNAILQLVCVKDISTAGWFYFKGKEIVGYDKETYCKYEHIVKWRNIARVKTEMKMPLPLIMGFDIEVNSTNPNAMPSAKKPGDKVFQISCVLSRPNDTDDKFRRFLLTLGKPESKIVGNNVEILAFDTESELLTGFTKFITKYNPQLIVGYNILNFDIPYMIERAKSEMCMYEFDQMSCRRYHHAPERLIKWSSSAYKNQEFQFLDAEGRLFVDLLPLVKRDYKFNNYKLKTISDFFLGETKDPLTPKGIFKCYREGMKRNKKGEYTKRAQKAMSVVGKYCVQDTVLCNKLVEVLQTWVGLCEMASTCNVPIFYLYTQGQQIKVYSQVYKYCMTHNIIVEKDGYKASEDESYTGATVFPPEPGAYDKVVPFDFSSLYPTTIIAYNIDYSTLVRDDSIPDSDCNIIEWEDHIGCEHDTQIRKVKPKTTMCAHRRYRFLKEPKGVMPSLLEFLLNARKETRKEIKNIKENLKDCDDDKKREDMKTRITVLNKRQLAYKVSANSMYGAMGVRRGYLPFLPGAMCTTAQGRKSIEKAAYEIQYNYGAKLVYGDTDSAYVHFPKLKTAAEIWDYCFAVEKEMYENNVFPKPMKLEFEEVIYWRFFILTKKRYMALSCGRDGKVSDKIMKKGVLLARRDNSKFIRDIYEKVIMMIFNKSFEKDVLYEIIICFNKLCSYSLDLKNFIITKSVGETGDYKIRELSKDPKKRLKRLADMKIPPEWENMPPSKNQSHVYKNKLEEIYILKSLPSQVQLAEKMRRRGKRVDAGSRMEYVITDTGNIKDKVSEKIEDPEYQKKYGSLIKIDHLYYIKLSTNPLDQALFVGYKVKDFVLGQYKLRCNKYKMMEEIRNMFDPKIKIEGEEEIKKPKRKKKSRKLKKKNK